MNIYTEVTKYENFLKGNYKYKNLDKSHLRHSVFNGNIYFKYYLKNYIDDYSLEQIDLLIQKTTDSGFASTSFIMLYLYDLNS